MNRKKIVIGESHLDVVDVGEGPTILLVHGFPLDHQMWKFQIGHLANEFRIICPDLAGFGTSPVSHDPPSMRGYAEDLVALLKGLEIVQPVNFCGLSMGGYIGWEFWKHFPERISRLIACDTRAANDTEQVRRARKIAAQSVMAIGAGAVADSMMGRLFYNADAEEKNEMTSEVHKVISNTRPESIAAGQVAMSQRSDATALLREIKIPTLFVVGEHDEITTPQEMAQNAELVSHSRFLKISNAGHMAPLENHVEFNRGLTEFLRS